MKLALLVGNHTGDFKMDMLIYACQHVEKRKVSLFNVCINHKYIWYLYELSRYFGA